MALLEGPPVIAAELRESVFVDSLSVVCHGRWLYHTLPPGSPACPHCPVPLPGLWREENRGSTKRKFLYAKFTMGLLLPRDDVKRQRVERPAQAVLTRASRGMTHRSAAPEGSLRTP